MHDDDPTLDGVTQDQLDPGAPLSIKRAFALDWSLSHWPDIFWWLR